MSSINSSNQIYHNYTVLSPDGIEMFRCDRKKFEWYLRKGLASQIDTDTIRLLFQPKGLGWNGEHFYLQDRENKCCVCGSEKELSKHHVIPYCYRKHMPENLKNNNYFDVLPLCMTCHRSYEKFAFKRKQELAAKHNAPIDGFYNGIKSKVYKKASSLSNYGHLIPEHRQKEMKSFIAKELGKDSVSDEEIKKLLSTNNKIEKTHGALVVSSLSSFQEFFEDWRTHFVSTMKPEHLPKYWEVERDSHGRKN